MRALLSKLAGGISSFLHVFTENWMEHFKTDLEPLCASGRFSVKTFKRCLFLLHKALNGIWPPLSQLHCVFSLWKLTRNCSWNTKIATLSWSADRMPTLSVWFGKESTMLPPQTTKKWSDARLRKALTGWSLDYTRASSHPKLSSCPQAVVVNRKLAWCFA